MKSKLKSAIAMVLLLALLTPGCTWFGGGGKASVDMMKKVPIDSTSFNYWSIKALGGEDVKLHPIYDKFTPSAEAEQLKHVGIMRKSINHAAKASGFGQGGVVLNVDFDLSSVKYELDSLKWVRSTRENVEIWTPPEGQAYKSMALMKSVIILGERDDVYACIDAIKKKEKLNLYEDQAMKVVADKLPEGIIMNIYKGGEYEDLCAYGKSYKKEGVDKLEMTAIYNFEDNPAAEKCKDAINNELGRAGFSQVKVERKGNLIQATGVIDISDFIVGLTW